MKRFRALISIEEARRLLKSSVSQVSRTERMRLDLCASRVVAENIVSKLDVPSFDRAMMDGFAVIANDTFKAEKCSPVTLRVVDTVHAGQNSSKKVSQGECVSIATGASLPDGADAVVMFEDTEEREDKVKIFKPLHPSANVSRKAEDISKGELVLRAGEFLSPSRIGVLAALGIEAIEVYEMPKVAVIPTGSEVQTPGSKLLKGQVYDINSYTIASVVRESGCVPLRLGIVKDEEHALRSVLDKTKESDCIVFSGGSSVGAKDLLYDVLAERGKILFHGLRIKPGKPTLCASLGDRIVFGMPGYPASCLLTAYILLAPFLRELARLPERVETVLKCRAAKRIVSVRGRHEFMPVRIEGDTAVPVFKQSSAITSLAGAHGYIEIPENIEVIEKGETVEVKLF